MTLVAPKRIQPAPVGMTTIKDQKLDELKSIYHDAVAHIVQSKENGILLFSHFGNFNAAKNESSLKLVESLILESGDKRQTMKRFCSLFIEVLQNITLHGARDRELRMHAFVVVSKEGDSYRLITGNLILKEDSPSLQERLTELNSMDVNMLRKLYIETLCNDEFSERGGAGLGLLTVAKKTESKIKFQFLPVDSSFDYFVMDTTLKI